MKDSRVGIIDVRAVRAVPYRVLRLLDRTFLIAFFDGTTTKLRGGQLPNFSNGVLICLAIFSLRRWYRTFYEISL